MRILHIISNLMTGGAESMLLKVVRALPDIEHVVLSMMSGGALGPVLRASGVPVFELAADRSAAALSTAPKVISTMRKVKPDLVQGWMYHGNLSASLAGLASGARRPVVWNVRQTLNRLTDEKPLTRAVILASSPLAHFTSAIIYNSFLAAEQHEKRGYTHDRRVVIPNGFDFEAFRPSDAAGPALRALLHLPDDALLVGRVGRNHPMKDNPTLFEGFARLVQERNDAHLVLVGRGMELGHADIANLIDRHGVGGRVHALGERLDIPALTAGFDIALSTSARSEGFPNVIGEAMAVGVPAVVTDVGQSADILGDPMRVISAGDPGALASALARLAAAGRSARRAIGERDRERVVARYDIAVIAGMYADLWRRCLRPKG